MPTNLVPKYLRRFWNRAAQKHERAAEERHEPNYERAIEEIAAAIHSVKKELNAQSEKNDPKKKHLRRWDHAGVLGLWAAAFVGVAAIYFGQIDSKKQGKRTDRQIAVMESDQRPWAHIVAAIPATDLLYISDKTGTYAATQIKFTVVDSGHAPAMDVNIELEMHDKRLWQPPPREDILGAPKGSVCGGNSWQIGRTIFPGSTDDFIQYAAIKTPELAELPKDATGIQPIIFGCVAYRFPWELVPHKSWFYYMVGAVNPFGPGCGFEIPFRPGLTKFEKERFLLCPGIQYAN